MRTALPPLVLAAAVLLANAGCAARNAGVPIDSRPTPAQPSSGGAPAATPAPATGTMSPSEPGTPDPRLSMRERIVADTTEARRVASTCLASTLLPDEEASLDALRDVLRRARVALLGEDLTRAASLARQARQLASALSCAD